MQFIGFLSSLSSNLPRFVYQFLSMTAHRSVTADPYAATFANINGQWSDGSFVSRC